MDATYLQSFLGYDVIKHFATWTELEGHRERGGGRGDEGPSVQSGGKSGCPGYLEDHVDHSVRFDNVEELTDVLMMQFFQSFYLRIHSR